jgi:hypothetical protein
MKKNLLFAFILLTASPVFSQQRPSLSFSASPSINWLSSDERGIESNKVRLGIDYGLNADFYFDDESKYAFATGLLIGHTGGNLTYNHPNSEGVSFAGEEFPSGTTFQYHLRYIEIPLAVKLKTSEFRRWEYWGQFGFSSFINIMAKGSSSNGTLDKDGINDEVNLFNLALNIGIGSNFDLGGNNAITMGIIYKNGFLDVTSNEMFDDRATLHSLVFKLGLLF